MSTPQRQRQDVFYYPSGYQSEYTLFHTSRVIKYVFLDGSQNIATSPSASSPAFESQLGYLESGKGCFYPLILPDHGLASSYWMPDFERLPIFVALSKAQEKMGGSWGRPLCSRDRLPVFRQLCGEAAVPSSARKEETVALSVAKDDLEKPKKREGQGLEKGPEREERMEKGKEAENPVSPSATREKEVKL